ncbi:MAG: DUF2330 domain-containing protein [Bacteroidetes bacterium]|nr:DUF2330 domain-containing protein [Bacteroidota bacterium]
MLQRTFAADPRWFQVIFQAFFLSYGLAFLHWSPDWAYYITTIAGCLAFSYVAETIRRNHRSPGRRPQFPPLSGKTGFHSWGLSILISAMGLCLLLKTNHIYTTLLAAFLTVASKYFIKFKGKHIFNPSAFGIAATILITKDAWLSPGQWGNGAVLFFLVLTLGAIIVTRVQKLDTSLGFLLTFAGLLYWRQVLILGWPQDYFLHSISSGSLLLFSFFMISDPKTAPNHPLARIIWSISIAVISFYLSAYKWLNNTPVWILVAAAPLVPLLDRNLRARSFDWQTSSTHFFPVKFKQLFMRTKTRKLAAIIILTAMISNEAMAFCGFYVSKADGTLKNKTSQVILVRDGEKNTVTMYNDFKGDFKDFAMVVPVPVVLKQSDIKVVDQSIFNTLNEYSKPRLVEYYDENPCEMRAYYDRLQGTVPGMALNETVVVGYGTAKRSGVTIEAKYLVGEYDILILSAKESAGLRTWLTDNGYKIPSGAEEVLEPYIRSNLKFFVVKVNEQEKKKLPGNFLRPIQISFESPKFMLPIRLGMANADGDQDMIVYAFSRTGRIECTNYPTVSLPTGKNIPLFVQNNFGNFYANLFQHQWFGAGKSVAMLEYAWDVSPSNYVKCDPCIATAPSTRDLVQAGVGWATRKTDPDDEDANRPAKVYFTRLHIRYNRQAFPQDLLFQETANTGNFQSRYIITHPATGDLSCEAGKKYLAELQSRRKDELKMLNYLTGKNYDDWDVTAATPEEKNIPAEDSYAAAAKAIEKPTGNRRVLLAGIGIIGLLSVIGLSIHTQKNYKPHKSA